MNELKNQQVFSIENIKKQLNHTEDLKDREVNINDVTYIILYISPLVDQEKLESKVIEPLIKMEHNDILNELYSKEIKIISNNEEAICGILDGYCLLLKKENYHEGFLLDVTETIGRVVSEPLTEKTLLGAHEGFVESLDKNIYLLRKRVKIPGFTVKKYILGSKVPTDVSLIYVNQLVNPEIIKKVEERLKSISLDFIRSPGDIQDCIEDQTFSPFPQLLDTELPERAASNLKDGRIALVIDGSPKAFILPVIFSVFFQSPDDYSSRWELGSFFRILRLSGYINALILPALYIAIVTYHYEVIPTELVYSFQSSLSFVPFRPIIELMGMQFTFELLREASIRLPTSIASTFGIVGALVVGTAMVEAGFVSYGGLIIVALTAVSSFVQPNIEMSSSIRVLGFPLMIMAGMFGFLGIMLGVLLILIHLSRLTSFGVPYFSPFAPLKVHEFKDTIIRVPVWMKGDHPKSSSRIQKGKMEREWKLNESEDPY
ncbi:spore germination protein [Bacillus sp. ISL-4]|uniref:spore germination protein n=1 Tax=Bacillus sp. ISL-4 TaxID=2819125 RepID=UPI001BE73343|nr:spore germination protein [Bacillus sp. ISL-4]MBT2668511.1 spore germination protein [Bacillus sp. ISL-4]MBT2675062.1 spore germination protein [Streptomyces sp. ISL-14]